MPHVALWSSTHKSMTNIERTRTFALWSSTHKSTTNIYQTHTFALWSSTHKSTTDIYQTHTFALWSSTHKSTTTIVDVSGQETKWPLMKLRHSFRAPAPATCHGAFPNAFVCLCIAPYARVSRTKITAYTAAVPSSFPQFLLSPSSSDLEVPASLMGSANIQQQSYKFHIPFNLSICFNYLILTLLIPILLLYSVFFLYYLNPLLPVQSFSFSAHVRLPLGLHRPFISSVPTNVLSFVF